MIIMLNRRPKTQGTSRLVRVSRFTPAGCQDDRTSFYAPTGDSTPRWEIHRDTCRCAFCS